MFIPFASSEVAHIQRPKRFTYPFNYEPHPLSLLAADHLKAYLTQQPKWANYFNGDDAVGRGKMFGVLVVKNRVNELGYLAAFSGKLDDSNHHQGFVPPVFDMLTDGSFFNQGMQALNAINQKVRDLQQHPDYLSLQNNWVAINNNAATDLELARQKRAAAKQDRKKRREQARLKLPDAERHRLEKQLTYESQQSKQAYKERVVHWQKEIEKAKSALNTFETRIETLREQRKRHSAQLQTQLFEQYQFLNPAGIRKSLNDIFVDVPPTSGAGECAAPKLLQYAFANGFTPLALAEFWWGASPKSAIRKHGQFYPACTSKCKPILGHMLDGIRTDPNPFSEMDFRDKKVEIIYEDAHFVVIHKPENFLSVPGKSIKDCVARRMQIRYPNASGPLVVHRLDMATSGLMLIAKSKDIHQQLQYLFMKRKISKRYVALLDGILTKEEGVIDLPLRVDLEDRPRQLVCYEHGKAARTHWKVVARDHLTQRTRIHFHPVTGRTHQLRVHAAHESGLSLPIFGDDLYGTKRDRLYLHAERLELEHPVSRAMVVFERKADF